MKINQKTGMNFSSKCVYASPFSLFFECCILHDRNNVHFSDFIASDNVSELYLKCTI